MLDINVTNFVTIAVMTMIVLVIGGVVERKMMRGSDESVS